MHPQYSNTSQLSMMMNTSLQNITMTTPQSGLEIFHICLTTIYVILIFTGNPLMIILIIRYPWFHCPQGSMLFSIALADLIIGADTLLGLVSLTNPNLDTIPLDCEVLGYMTAVAISVNVLTIALLSFDRWLIIHQPFRYSIIMDTKKAIGINVAIWALSFLTYVAYFFDLIHFHIILDSLKYICIVDVDEEHKPLLALVSVPAIIGCTVIFTFAILTCRTAHTQARRIADQQITLQAVPRRSGTRSHASTSTKYVRTTLLIIVAFTLTWLPTHILQIVMATNANMKIPDVLMYIFAWLLVSNSCINWIICLTTNTRFMKSTKLLLHDFLKCLHRHKAVPNATQSQNGPQHESASTHGTLSTISTAA